MRMPWQSAKESTCGEKSSATSKPQERCPVARARASRLSAGACRECNRGAHGRVCAPQRTGSRAEPVDGCGSRFLVEGIQFRLEALPLATLPGVTQDMRQDLIDLTERFAADLTDHVQRHLT